MTRPRVDPLDAAPAKQAAADAGIPDYMADLSVFRVLLRNQAVARGLNGLLAALLWEGVLDHRLRELVIMRIGWVTGSVYEWTQHWRVAVSLGVSPDDLLAVRHGPDHPAFGPVERAVLGATDDVLSTGQVSAPSFEACRTHLDDAALVELVAVIGNWSMFSSLLRSLEVPLEDGVEPWPPDGVAPGVTG